MAKKSAKPKKSQIIQSPKGMHDILPQDQPLWNKIRKVSQDVAGSYNFSRIDTPVLESADIFERPLGEKSDVVQKEMYTLRTKGGDRLVLRPEATASIARAYIQHGLSHLSQPLKLYYEGPMFRHERPQAGRLRQFHQAGFEIISSDDDPIYDAQIILASTRVIERLKIKGLSIQVNTIGCKNCRPTYVKKLQGFYKGKDKLICKQCHERIKSNPLRLLDCKAENCQIVRKNAPILLDNICAPCKKHFKSVLEYLEELNVPYVLNPHLVRGFDYYTRTVFEIFTDGEQHALGGGGRYDYLVKMLGGKQSPAIGAALGWDRIARVIKDRQIQVASKSRPKIFLVHIGAEAKKKSLGVIEELLENKIEVVESLGKESLKNQLRVAHKIGAPFVLILGQKEVFEKSVIIRNMKSGSQETVALSKITAAIKRKLK